MLLTIASFAVSTAAALADPNGLYLMTRMNMGSSLEIKGWYFKNGQVTTRPSGNLASFDFRAAASANPGETGTYSIAGDKMTIKWANGKSSNGRYESSDHNCFYFDMGLFCPAEPFKTATIEGTYEGGASAGYGAVSTTKNITFRKDGTYTLGAVGSVRSVGRETSAWAGSSGTETGTYSISGTTLTMKGPKGTQQLVAFPYDDGSKGPQPRRIVYEGIVLKRIN